MSNEAYHGRVQGRQRYTRAHPCPVCGGGHDDPAGESVRCYGIEDSTGRYARCTREEFAGSIKPNDDLGPTFSHYLDGPCLCGADHREAQPRRKKRPTVPPPGVTLAEIAAAKQIPMASLGELQVRDGIWTEQGRQVPAVYIPHWDEEGEPVSNHVRVALDQVKNRFRWDGPMIPYGLWRLHEIRQKGWVLLAFGDSDCWAGWLYDLPVISIPGQTAWQPEWARHFEGLKLYLWQEPGEERASRRVALDLPSLTVIRGWQGVKDLCELHQIIHAQTPDMILHLRQQAQPVKEEASAEPPADGQKVDASDLTTGPRMGRYLESLHPMKMGQDHRLWRYQDGIWKADGMSWARARCVELLDNLYTRRHWQELESWLGGRRVTTMGEPDPDWLNLPNGRLHWSTGELARHEREPSHLDTVRIPVEWRPGASCDRYEQFLGEVLPPDAIEFVWEVSGYLLIPDTRFQKAVMLLGRTGTGKGTLLHVLRHLLGAANVAAITLHQFSDNRFAPAQLVGKLANLLGDLDARTVERSDMFKMISGEDVVNVERKNQQGFDVKLYCRLVFSANEPPPTADQTDAYFGRWLVVPMNSQFRDTPREDTGLRQRLTQVGELEGILQRSVAGLRRLMKRGRFDVPTSVLEANADYRKRLNVTEEYLDDWMDAQTPISRGGPVWFPFEARRMLLYQDFEEWCKRTGRKALSRNLFYSRVREDPRMIEIKLDGRDYFRALRRDI